MKTMPVLFAGAIAGLLLAGLLGAMPAPQATAPATSTGAARPRWEYAVLTITETSVWGTMGTGRSLLWITPRAGAEGVRRASDPNENNLFITYPKEFFAATDSTHQDDGNEALLLSEIGEQGWQLVTLRDERHDVILDGVGDKPDRKATEHQHEWTFMRQKASGAVEDHAATVPSRTR
jgi:hypothetical protein